MLACAPPTAADTPLVTTLHARVVTGQGGGPEKTILRSPRYLRGQGYRELCGYLRAPGDAGFAALQQQAQEQEAELIPFDDRGPLDWGLVRRLARFCRQEQVRIWHGHDYKSNLLGLLVRRHWPLRLVTTVHGWVHHTRRTPFYYFVDRCCLPWYDRVLCVSPDLEQACLRAGVPPQRCQTLANGIECDHFTRRQTPAAARARLGLAPDALWVGGIGRLAPEKNFAALLAAVARGVAQGLPLRCVLVGEGAERPALERQCRTLGLTDRVHFAGQVADVRPWLEALDLFVLSSLREALPNVVLEAMAMETPTIATAIAGVPDLLDQGRAGLLVPPGDVAALAEALAALATDPGRRAELAATARRRVTTHFSFGQRMERMRAIYDELLADEFSADELPASGARQRRSA